MKILVIKPVPTKLLKIKINVKIVIQVVLNVMDLHKTNVYNVKQMNFYIILVVT